MHSLSVKTLQHSTAHYNKLQHTATTTAAHLEGRYNKLQHTATSTATHCNKHCNKHCSTLQHTTSHCSTLQHTSEGSLMHSLSVSTQQQPLQHTATRCNTLQHTATHLGEQPHAQPFHCLSTGMHNTCQMCHKNKCISTEKRRIWTQKRPV